MMRILFTCLVLCWAGLVLYAQGVTIGSNQSPDPAAVLDLQSSNQGFLLPRLTTTQRNAIPNPPVGLQIFNTTLQCVETYFASGWRATACECVLPPGQPGSITGPNEFCINQTSVSYSVPLQADATGYVWSLPPGAMIATGQNSNSVTVNFGNTGGSISVAAVNGCGLSSNSLLAVNPSTPSAAFSPVNGVTNLPVTFTPNAVYASYVWSFASGSPSTSNVQNPQVTWSAPGTYAVQLMVTNALGCSDTVTQNVTIVNCVPVSQTFTTCGATGRTGPSQSQCDVAYGSSLVTVSGGKQTWVVPYTGTYRITAAGAQGGGTLGGNGAVMEGDFSLIAGQTLVLLVGQRGNTNGGSGGCGGGGGTFVYDSQQSSLLLAAGGGGGMDCYSSGNTAGYPGTSTTTNARSNSTIGAGGLYAVQNGSSGGAGWNSNGATDSWSTGGERFLTTGYGGTGYNGSANGTWSGGFGGGGGSTHSGGGGGGYTGGHPGYYMASSHNSPGGGAGSYNAGTNQNNQSGANSGHGSITITRICQ